MKKFKVDVRSTALTARSQLVDSASMTTTKATDSDTSKVNHSLDQRAKLKVVLILIEGLQGVREARRSITKIIQNSLLAVNFEGMKRQLLS